MYLMDFCKDFLYFNLQEYNMYSKIFRNYFFPHSDSLRRKQENPSITSITRRLKHLPGLENTIVTQIENTKSDTLNMIATFFYDTVFKYERNIIEKINSKATESTKKRLDFASQGK